MATGTSPRSASDPAGVAILGTIGRERHIAAIAAVKGLHLVPGGDAREGTGPEEILADARVRIVTVLAAVADGSHWIERALEGGRAVLSAAPPAATPSHAARLANAARAAGTVLLVESTGADAGFAADVLSCAGGVSPALYARLCVVVPRSWLQGRREGLLESEALWAVPLLVTALGPLDAVAAHTRALVRNQPKEDFAIAHLTFASGTEGLLEAHALAANAARATFEIYGPRDEARVDADLHRTRCEGLQPLYERLRDAAAGTGGTRALDSHGIDASGLEEALRLADWVRQSARLARRLHRREVAS